ncbi:MAG: hypothetical protein P0S95_03720 [Rhabdochlamydiaceae bacterium]|nr:hypothetical protein [Candidatus Amphrikana amoebophyrae]
MKINKIFLSLLLLLSSNVHSEEWMHSRDFSIEQILVNKKFDQVVLYGEKHIDLANVAVGRGIEVYLINPKLLHSRPNTRLGRKNADRYFPRNIVHRSLDCQSDLKWILDNKPGNKLLIIDPTFLVKNKEIDFQALNLLSKLNDTNNIIVLECHSNLIEDDVGESLYLLDNIEDFLNVTLDGYEVENTFTGNGETLTEYLIFYKE